MENRHFVLGKNLVCFTSKQSKLFKNRDGYLNILGYSVLLWHVINHLYLFVELQDLFLGKCYFSKTDYKLCLFSSCTHVTLSLATCAFWQYTFYIFRNVHMIFPFNNTDCTSINHTFLDFAPLYKYRASEPGQE